MKTSSFARSSFVAIVGALALAFAAAGSSDVHAQSGRTHAVIVVGIGGTAEFRESFHAEASQIYTALTTMHGLPKEDVIYLGERVETARRVRFDASEITCA